MKCRGRFINFTRRTTKWKEKRWKKEGVDRENKRDWDRVFTMELRKKVCEGSRVRSQKLFPTSPVSSTRLYPRSLSFFLLCRFVRKLTFSDRGVFTIFRQFSKTSSKIWNLDLETWENMFEIMVSWTYYYKNKKEIFFLFFDFFSDLGVVFFFFFLMNVKSWRIIITMWLASK